MSDASMVGLLTIILESIEDLKKDVAYIKESTARRDALLAKATGLTTDVNTIMDDAKELLNKAKNNLLIAEGEANFGKIET